MEPVHTHVQNKGRLTTNDRQPPLAVGASLCSLPCGLFMQYETSLYAVTQLIRDARRLLSCVRMGFAFYAAGCMSITLMLLLSFCLLLPPIMTGYQIIWMMWVILPTLSISMLFTPHEDGIMLLMPGKKIIIIIFSLTLDREKHRTSSGYLEIYVLFCLTFHTCGSDVYHYLLLVSAIRY